MKKEEIVTTTPPKEQKTTKKIKYHGVQKYINADTGELVEMQVTDIEERDFNFHKVWMKTFIYSLDLIGNQKLKVATEIIQSLNRENQLIMTQRALAEKAEVSLSTVTETINILKDANFLKQTSHGVYAVNPNILYKGTRSARMNALMSYHAPGEGMKTHITKEKRIEQIKNSIRVLQEELVKLDGDIVDAECDDQYSFNEKGEVYQKARPIKLNMKKGKKDEA